MRKIIMLFGFGLLAASAVIAETVEPVYHVDFSRIRQCRPNVGMNKRTPGGIRKLAEDGRTGKCVEIKNTPTSLFTFYHDQLPLTLGNDKVKVSVWVKGKGSFQFQLYYYSAAPRFVSGASRREVKVNTVDWRQEEYTFHLPQSSKYMSRIAVCRVAFKVFEASAIKFDDLECFMISGSQPTGGLKPLVRLEQAEKDQPKTEKAKEVIIVKKTFTKKVDLALLDKFYARANVNEKPAPLPKGAAVTKTAEGIMLKYVFPTVKHDALMFDFDVDIPEFSHFSLTMDGDKSKHAMFVVFEDVNKESHYAILGKSSQLTKLGSRSYSLDKVLPYFHKQVHSFRWGGDKNQKIDFPIKKVTLGINDYPDTFIGNGQIVFKDITFSLKKEDL